jgi:hypothetical protein
MPVVCAHWRGSVACPVVALWCKRVPSANSVAGGVGDHATEPALSRLPRSLRHESMLPTHGIVETSVPGRGPT